MHSLRGLPDVMDICDCGLIVGIELAPRRAGPRTAPCGYSAVASTPGCLLVRTTGDTVALSLPLVVERAQVDRMVETLGDAVRAEAG